MRRSIALLSVPLLAIGMSGAASASPTMLEPFTQAELDDNWGADRRFPTDGVDSVTAFERDEVARIGIDSAETAPGGFQRTEGIKTGVEDFEQAVQVDLYIDPAWEGNAVRAGLWVAGDIEGARSNFGIIEFVNSEDCSSPDCTTDPSNITEHEGFRVWDSNDGWTDVEVGWDHGEWVTLLIVLNGTDDAFEYAVDGQSIDEVADAGGATHIREVFLNSYNYGLDTFPTLTSDSYAAHWHVGVTEIDSKDQCTDENWEDAGFRNQGQCIRFVNTGQDSR